MQLTALLVALMARAPSLDIINALLAKNADVDFQADVGTIDYDDH